MRMAFAKDNVYKWGFSFIMLFVFCIFTVIFAIALAYLRLEVYWYSRVTQIDVHTSIYHDVLALADEIRAVLYPDTSGWTEMTGRELERKLSQRFITVDTAELPLSRSQERKIRNLRSRQRFPVGKEDVSRSLSADASPYTEMTSPDMETKLGRRLQRLQCYQCRLGLRSVEEDCPYGCEPVMSTVYV